MARFTLRKVENQAQVSILASLLSVLPWAAMTFFILKNMWPNKEWVFYYGSKGKAGILICSALALLLSTIGFGLGLNSAGQRRNEKQQLSWIGFFIGGMILTLTIVVLALFFVRGELVPQ